MYDSLYKKALTYEKPVFYVIFIRLVFQFSLFFLNLLFFFIDMLYIFIYNYIIDIYLEHKKRGQVILSSLYIRYIDTKDILDIIIFNNAITWIMGMFQHMIDMAFNSDINQAMNINAPKFKE